MQKKISLENLQGKLSRAEMKTIMAGVKDDGGIGPCPNGMSCEDPCPSQTSCKKESHLSYCACYTT
jgi:hypothetical protein